MVAVCKFLVSGVEVSVAETWERKLLGEVGRDLIKKNEFIL